MAETIGLIASCVQLAELATKSIKTLHSLQKKFSNAARTIELLSSQLLAVKSAVKHISLWLDQSPPESIWSGELRDTLIQSLESCGDLLEKISEYSYHLDNDSRVALLLDRMKYVWKADEFREFQGMLRDHVQALSFLLQVAELPNSCQQDNLLRRAESRHIINKPRDDSSSLLRLKDEQSIGIPIEAIHDDLSSFSAHFDFDYEALSSHTYQATLASFMKQKLNDSASASTRPRGATNKTDAGSITLQDVLSEIDHELEAIEPVKEERPPNRFPSIEHEKPLVEENLEDTPHHSTISPSYEKHGSTSSALNVEEIVNHDVTQRSDIGEPDSAPSFPEQQKQGYETERQAEIHEEPDSFKALRKVQSTSQLSRFSMHRSSAHRATRRTHSDTPGETKEQRATRPTSMLKEEDPVDELFTMFEDSARGKASEPRKIEDLAIRLRTNPNFLRRMSPPDIYQPHEAHSRLNRGDIAARLASRAGAQSELEAFNRQAILHGYSTVWPEEFQVFQKAWAVVDPSRSRYIPKERLLKLVGCLEGPFNLAIYENEFTVTKICSKTSDSQTSAELANIVNTGLAHLPARRTHARRKRLNFFVQEALFCADPSLGLNFSEVLKILTYYRNVDYFVSWRKGNNAEIEQAVEVEDLTLLERCMKRRARLLRVEEIVSVEMLKGWMETFYWKRRFRHYLEAKRKMGHHFEAT